VLGFSGVSLPSFSSWRCWEQEVTREERALKWLRELWSMDAVADRLEPWEWEEIGALLDDEPGEEGDYEDELSPEQEAARHEFVKKIAEEHGFPLSDWKPVMPPKTEREQLIERMTTAIEREMHSRSFTREPIEPSDSRAYALVALRVLEAPGDLQAPVPNNAGDFM
jgi:hypothetical protein